MVSAGELTLGEAARILRSGVLGFDRKTFARTAKLSTSIIAKLEDDPKANPTIDTISKVFALFGGKVGLVFPRLEEPPPLGEAQQKRRDLLRSALDRSRRKKRGPRRR